MLKVNNKDTETTSFFIEHVIACWDNHSKHCEIRTRKAVYSNMHYAMQLKTPKKSVQAQEQAIKHVTLNLIF